MSTAVNGFKCSGIWPCDRNIWTDADFAAAGRFELSYLETDVDGPSMVHSAIDATVQNDNSSNKANTSNNRSLSTCEQRSNYPCPSTSKQQLNELSPSTSNRQNGFRRVTTNPSPPRSDQQSNAPSLSASKQQQSDFHKQQTGWFQVCHNQCRWMLFLLNRCHWSRSRYAASRKRQ